MYSFGKKPNSTFQSTPLMRGETITFTQYFNDRSISIHSPHARGDICAVSTRRICFIFQSTPLMRGETVTPISSTHADRSFQSTPLMRGETLLILCYNDIIKFQSTPLMRGETATCVAKPSCMQISIHSPHARGDKP